MNLNDQNLEWKLCEAYFSILEKNITSQISFEELAMAAKISREQVEKIVPKQSTDYRFFF